MPSTCLTQTARLGSLQASLSSQQQLANRNASWARPVPKSSKLKGRRQLWHVLEDGRAVACFWHRWEMIAAFWARLGQYCLFDVQIERLVLNVRASRADADQPGSLELEVRDDVLHDRAGAHRPFLGMLVVGIHVPVVQSLVARPEADLVMPSRILRVRPPS